MRLVLFLIFLVLILANILWYSWRYGITPTPTSSGVKKVILKVLPSLIPGKILELGSGWGNVAFTLARHFPQNTVEAYEISPFPYLTSKLIGWLLPYPNLFFIRKNFFTVSLKDASLVICYLYPGAMNLFRKIIFKFR